MRIRGIAIAGALALATAAPLALAAGAGATVNPTPLEVQTAAGAYAAPTASHLADGDHMTGVKATFYTLNSARFALSDSSLWNFASTDGSFAEGPMLGVELCTATS